MNRRGFLSVLGLATVARPKLDLNPKPCSKCHGTGLVASVDEPEQVKWFSQVDSFDFYPTERITAIDCPKCGVKE
jgi:hypothetical protein